MLLRAVTAVESWFKIGYKFAGKYNSVRFWGFGQTWLCRNFDQRIFCADDVDPNDAAVSLVQVGMGNMGLAGMLLSETASHSSRCCCILQLLLDTTRAMLLKGLTPADPVHSLKLCNASWGVLVGCRCYISAGWHGQHGPV